MLNSYVLRNTGVWPDATHPGCIPMRRMGTR